MIGGSGQPLQLTQMPSFIGSAAWSPDGHSIAYDRVPETSTTEEKSVEIVMVPSLPGHEVVLTRCYSAGLHGVSWSSDGKSLAFSDRERLQDPTAIFLIDKDTLERRRLTTAPKGTLGDSNPTFSSDGKRIAFIRILTEGITQLAVLALDTNKVIVLQTEDSEITGLAWAPNDNDIIYAANKTGISGLWRISTSGTKLRALPVGADAVSVAVSPRAHRLAYTRGSLNTNIWRIQFGVINDQPGMRTKLIASSRQEVQPAFSPDGTRIAFTSNRSGPQEIWLCRSDGSDTTQLTHLANRRTGTPRWSPDGAQIVFDSRQAGHSNIYVVAADGGAPRRITDSKFDSSQPSWSADGKSIYFTFGAPLANSSDTQIWKVPAIGGQAVQVTQHGGEVPLEGPDGKTLYYVNPKNEAEIWQKVLPTGEEQRVTDIFSMSNSMSWQVTKEGIYFADSGFSSSMQQTGAMRFFSFATKKTSTLATLGNPKVAFGISVRDNGRTILYSEADHIGSNLLLVENFH
jgi:Tol biopolymer transport system component